MVCAMASVWCTNPPQWLQKLREMDGHGKESPIRTACMHPFIHAYKHTYKHTCKHTGTHTGIHTYMHTYIHALHTHCASPSGRGKPLESLRTPLHCPMQPHAYMSYNHTCIHAIYIYMYVCRSHCYCYYCCCGIIFALCIACA